MKKLVTLLSVAMLLAFAAAGGAAARGGGDDDGTGHVRGNCDEAEHAKDPECAGTAKPRPATKGVPAAAGTKLVGAVGPGFTITLKTAGGKVVRSAKPGTYSITVRDASGDHNFHLSGPGVNRATSEGGTGTVTWRVKLARGAYKYVCDPHVPVMNGTLRVA
jgi:plastocyanin